MEKKGFSLLALLSLARDRATVHKEAAIENNSDVALWTCARVGEWIESFNELSEYADIFKQNEITGADLLEITEYNLEHNLNITKLGHIKRIMREIRILSQTL